MRNYSYLYVLVFDNPVFFSSLQHSPLTLSFNITLLQLYVCFGGGVCGFKMLPCNIFAYKSQDVDSLSFHNFWSVIERRKLRRIFPSAKPPIFYASWFLKSWSMPHKSTRNGITSVIYMMIIWFFHKNFTSTYINIFRLNFFGLVKSFLSAESYIKYFFMCEINTEGYRELQPKSYVIVINFCNFQIS